MSFHHIPVMLNEVVEHLVCRPGKVIADGTVGGAGHAEAICRNIMPGGILVGVDQDKDAIRHAQQRLAVFGSGVRLFHDNFAHLADILQRIGIEGLDGICLDLGLSLHQLTSSGRGFSFQQDEPLDMRMNVDTEITAADLVARLSAEELARVFRTYGEERLAKPIARELVRHRQKEPIRTTGQLTRIVSGVVLGRQKKRPPIHPATRVFQALRIAVNRELERLETFMNTAADLLRPGGRLCVISFHSLEDRIVKQSLKSLSAACTCPPRAPICTCGGTPKLRLPVRKGLQATKTEIEANPMARSARLRVAERN
ncbi:MAG: 16S rRNA (cytosine(1402)-N(4))-methyltransferase RsmH [Desulfobacteraceae bacterium]|jgi:16S rRNA (cytosine1402-N4)-methyltransferase|nr:16S rRNA (cytosine(1402)-N(4))-methyltransferase RsmH [Desulfobacteraceae bacterium]